MEGIFIKLSTFIFTILLLLQISYATISNGQLYFTVDENNVVLVMKGDYTIEENASDPYLLDISAATYVGDYDCEINGKSCLIETEKIESTTPSFIALQENGTFNIRLVFKDVVANPTNSSRELYGIDLFYLFTLRDSFELSYFSLKLPSQFKLDNESYFCYREVCGLFRVCEECFKFKKISEGYTLNISDDETPYIFGVVIPTKRNIALKLGFEKEFIHQDDLESEEIPGWLLLYENPWVIAICTGFIVLLIWEARNKIKVWLLDIFCDKCSGKGKVSCGVRLCKEGYLAPNPRKTGHSNGRLVDKKDEGVFYRMDDIKYNNDGGRGKAKLIINIYSALDDELLGSFSSEEIPFEARVGGHIKVIEIKLENFADLKRKLSREPGNDDVYEKSIWKITDKGEPCSSCNGSGWENCPVCKGKRINFFK